MRAISLIVVLALSAPLAVQAADVPSDTPPAASATAAPAPAPAAAPPADEPYPHFGAMLGLGVPDGAVISLVGSPWYWLLLDAGFAYTLSPGMVFGLTLRPIDFFISPTLRGEYGYYFTTSALDKVKDWVGVPPELSPLIGEASYHWFSGYIGAALGSRRGFTANIEVGMGYLAMNVKGGTSTQSDGSVVSLSQTKFTSVAPMARLSFAYYF